MLVTAFPSPIFAANCFILAPAAGEECLVVDPGIEANDWVADTVREHKLRPAAVLLTHGHLDHVYTVTPVCTTYEVPALIHGEDSYRLSDPISTMSPELVAMLEQQFGAKSTWAEPSEIRTLTDTQHIEIAGLDVQVIHAPGHTEGSAMFHLPGGDVLFAGGIGRTDLPGGDSDAMRTSLREKVMALPDDALVLPGHGPGTLMARERVTNPYLSEQFLSATGPF